MPRYDPSDTKPDRQYTHEAEQELWDEFRYRALDPTKYDRVEVTPIGRQLGMHEQQVRDTVRTWVNADLAIEGRRGNYNAAIITERGRYTIDPRNPAGDDELPE